MSHQPERNEKNCLNCGTTVLGRYCHVCGQENVETKETFFALLKHFVYDIFHFDTKFFDTLKYVLVRPGYIAKHYVQGQRARFLHPIRMYLFTSALFFLVFFSFKDPKAIFSGKGVTYDTLSRAVRADALSELEQELAEKPGDTTVATLVAHLRDTTQIVTEGDLVGVSRDRLVGFGEQKYKSVLQYDSLQKALPPSQRDGWLKHRIYRKAITINAKYNGDVREEILDFSELFLHKLSYLLFFSLPFFALILKLLYVRRANFYYSDHAIFTLYHYIFSFILLLVVLFLGQLSDWTGIPLFQKLIPFILLLWPVYLFAALKNFYGQGWGRTFSKFLLLNLLGIIVLLLLFVVFLFFTLLQL